MEEEKLRKIKEYLKLRKIQEEDNSTKMIKEVYEEVVNKNRGDNKDD